MKVILPADEGAVCVSFGRAPFFCLYDTENGEKTMLENPAAEAAGGAGVQAAQFVVDTGASAVITVRCGENSAEVLLGADITIYKAEGTSLDENIAAWQAGQLSVLTHFHAGYHGIR